MFSLSCPNFVSRGERAHTSYPGFFKSLAYSEELDFLKALFSLCAVRTRKSEMSVMKKGSPRRMLSKSSDHRFHLSVHSFATLMLCSYLHTNQSKLSTVNALDLGWYFVG